MPGSSTRVTANTRVGGTGRSRRDCAGAMRLLEPLALGPRTAPNRVMFGPHVTNLGDDDRRYTAPPHRLLRAPGARRVRHDRRRGRQRPRVGLAVRAGATGGAGRRGLGGDRRRLPARTAPLVVASLDHAGGQGSSAYNQAPLWAPSRVPEVATREVPKWMEADDIAAVVAGFAAAAGTARAAGCDGVEINAGQHSLVRQFLSGLTNQRGDEWGADRLRFAREVIDAVRAAVGAGTDRRAAAVVRRARAVGRHHARRWRRGSPPRWWPAASTTSSSCGARSSRSSRPVPTSTSRRASTSTLAAAVAAARRRARDPAGLGRRRRAGRVGARRTRAAGAPASR